MNGIDPALLCKNLSKVLNEIGVKSKVTTNDSKTILLVSFDLVEAYNLTSWLKFVLLEWRRKRSLAISKLFGDKSQPMN